MKLAPRAENLMERIALITNLAPRPLLDTQIAFTAARAIMVAAEVGLFEALGKGDQTAEAVAAVLSRCGAVALGRTYLLPPLSFGGASMVPPWLRFHIPLIEPDMPISRIRLSDKSSRFRVQRLLQFLTLYRS